MRRDGSGGGGGGGAASARGGLRFWPRFGSPRPLTFDLLPDLRWMEPSGCTHDQFLHHPLCPFTFSSVPERLGPALCSCNHPCAVFSKHTLCDGYFYYCIFCHGSNCVWRIGLGSSSSGFSCCSTDILFKIC